ncbi:MAG: AAA family ATPase, partial [bacterium]
MKSFHTIAIPHKDIQEGRFNLEVYAANLWSVYKGRGPEEYKQPEEFFKKTYKTKALSNLFDEVEKRIRGEGGSSIIQLQTPFGGGKTHSLIALYHKAKEWNANRIVMVGEEMDTGQTAEGFQTPWGLFEEQLTGKIDAFKGVIPPGGDQIRKLLEKYSPLLILMDEMIPYLNAADGVTVNEKPLSSLILTFIETLTNVVSSMPNVAFILTTTPSNPSDKSERGVEIVKQLQNIAGRTDFIKTPVEEKEISSIIRQRLFNDIDEPESKEVVEQFVSYAKKNDILPENYEATDYKKQFLSSYPFLPEVIDILYQRWGSFPDFQRTRGVLRLLALVIHSVKNKNIPYISLADFDLSNQQIRRELLKYIDNQFDSVIAKDITSKGGGAERVNASIGDAYKGLNLGKRTATAIFMYSHSGGSEKGITLKEAKLVSTTLDNPASIISDIFEDLKHRLFYLNTLNQKYLFTTEPNLNQLLYNKVENIADEDVRDTEQEIFKKYLSNNHLKCYLWPEKTLDIPDNQNYKLVILQNNDKAFINKILDRKGESLRVYRNTLFFLVPNYNERNRFENTLKTYLAYHIISKDQSLNLNHNQKDQVKNELSKIKESFLDDLRRLYRLLVIPYKNDLKNKDLGIPAYGSKKSIDDEVFEDLKNEDEIIEKISPTVIIHKYLRNEYVQIKDIYETGLNTKGETRFLSFDNLMNSIKQGVKNGDFGIGNFDSKNKPICKHYKESVVGDYGFDIIIKKEICESQKYEETNQSESQENQKSNEEPSKIHDSVVNENDFQKDIDDKKKELNTHKQLKLEFDVPQGKVSQLMGMMNYIQRNFNKLSIEIKAEDGEITEQEYEDKIRETLSQLGIDK